MLGFLRRLLGGSPSPDAGTGSGPPAKAKSLHEQGRKLGSAGKYDAALKCLEEAAALAPAWPHPPYDMAFTHLLKGDSARALEFYEIAGSLAPNGFFFKCPVAIWTLKAETEGRFPAGTWLRILETEWKGTPDQKRASLRGIVSECPECAPAWKELSGFAESPDEALAATESGLAAECDRQTRSWLLFQKAQLLLGAGKTAEAQPILSELARGNPADTDPSVKAFANLSLGGAMEKVS